MRVIKRMEDDSVLFVDEVDLDSSWAFVVRKDGSILLLDVADNYEETQVIDLTLNNIYPNVNDLECFLNDEIDNGSEVQVFCTTKEYLKALHEAIGKRIENESNQQN